MQTELSNSLAPRFMFIGCVLGFAAAVTSCATAPAFHPEADLARTSSLQEAMLVCHDYRVPRPPSRPHSLKPYLDCVNSASRLYSAGFLQPGGIFSVFRGELDSLYSDQKDQGWKPEQGIELETAIRATLRGLWRIGPQDGSYTSSEQSLALKHFPHTSELLQVRKWRLSTHSGFDPSLERLKAGVTSLLDDPSESISEPAKPEVHASTVGVCRELASLRQETQYLDALFRDQDEMTEIAPENSSSVLARHRYNERLTAAARRLNLLRPQVFAMRQSGSLRVNLCR